MSLGTQTKPAGKLLDYEQFIDHQLHRTRARIKLTDIMTASLTLVVGFLGVLFLEVVLDHVFGLPLLLRRIVLAGGLVTALAFAALRVAMPFIWRINSIYAAKTIEDADPAFKNSLINYLELRRYRGRLPKAIMATLEARAVSDLTQVEVDTVVNQQRLMRMAYALSAVIVIFCVYAAFAPKSILDSAKPRVPRRRGAPDQHPAGEHQARQRSRPFQEASPASTSCSRSTSRECGRSRSCCITASTAASSSPSRTSPPGPTCTTPGR